MTLIERQTEDSSTNQEESAPLTHNAMSHPPTRIVRVTFLTPNGCYIDYCEMPGVDANIIITKGDNQLEMSYECFDIERARKTLNMLVMMSDAQITS